MSLVVVVSCGAGNALHGLEISMFWYFLKLYFKHISKDILLRWAQNAISQCKWYFSRKLLCQGLRKCTIGKSTIMLVRSGNALHGLEISMFWYFLKLYFIHISKDILLRWAQNAISQCKWYFSRKLLCQGLRKCTIGKSTIMLVRTAVSYMIQYF